MSTRASVDAEPSFLGHLGESAMENDQVEKNMLKAKLQSCNTINTFFHETRKEIASLSQQIYLRDSVIADLKARLGRYETLGVQVDGEEAVVFGPSKSLTENLCKEIGKLKKTMKDTEIRTAQQLDTAKLEIQRLTQQAREQERESAWITSRSEQEKDQEIRRLRRDLAEKERAQATRAVLCSSLAEEAEQLRAQLGSTVRVCQELIRRLERERPGSGAEERPSLPPQGPEGRHTTTAAQLNSLECKVLEENKALKQRVAYVESLNSKWQKYDSSREEYVKGLCQKLKEASSQSVLGLAPANSDLLQQEIGRLNRLLEEKMSDCSKLGRELDEAKRVGRERILTLEQQVLIYADDFKSERADRERAQSRIQDLQEEVARFRLQLRKQNPRDPPAPCRAHSGHRVPAHGRTDTGEALLRSRAEKPGAKGHSGASAHAPGRTLLCPRCHTSYDDEHTVEYLIHCEECAKL